MLKGFRNFLMQGELIVIAVGLVIALAFSTLILAFTSNIITPLVNAAGGGGAAGKGLGWTINGQRIDLGDRRDEGGLAHPEAARDDDLRRGRAHLRGFRVH